MLQEYTQKAPGFSIGCRLFRQITIAITEKHVTSISRLFDRYDDQSGEATSSVGFAWQSGHRPNERGARYGIDGAFPDRLQPSLLNIYREVSRMWQHFLKLDDPSPVVNDATSVTNKGGQPSKTLFTANESTASHNEASSRVEHSKRRATSTLADGPAPKRTQTPMPDVFSEEEDA